MESLLRPNSGEKLSKLERKALKKQAKKVFTLKSKEHGLQISNEPTRHLVVGNGGLICGMERSVLLKMFRNHGLVRSLYMIPGKSFSLVSFNTVDEAINAYQHINGRAFHSSDELSKPDGVLKTTNTIYLAYLQDKFDKESLCKWNLRPVLPSEKELHPPGLLVIKDFISKSQEANLLEYFKMNELISISEKSMKHRRVKHFGYEFIYGKNDIDKNNPLSEKIPEICTQIIEKMTGEYIVDWRPDQLTVNQYEIGQGIPLHTDTHSAFRDGIISLSLGSQVVMEFSHPDGREVSLMLPGRSLLVMKEECRYLWNHGITPRKTDIVLDTSSDIDGDIANGLTLKERGFRMSLTFRRILREPCTCKFPKKCDSQGYNALQSDGKPQKEAIFVPNNENEARKLEADHVYEVYDEIADHFSDTRHSPWPKVARFLQDLPRCSLVADAGCGNGKYLGVNSDILTFGSDRSVNLVKICRERGHCAIVCDILSLPYRSNSFDASISIAVIHHLSTKERRTKALQELLRIVKPNGLVLIYVWALEQDKESGVATKNQTKFGDESDILEKTDNGDRLSHHNEMRPTITINETRNVFKQQDLLIPWHFRGKKGRQEKDAACHSNGKERTKGTEEIYHRFYHVFIEGELEELCYSIGEVKIINSYNDKGNWCVVLQKL